jgi:hypothetical protein
MYISKQCLSKADHMPVKWDSHLGGYWFLVRGDIFSGWKTYRFSHNLLSRYRSLPTRNGGDIRVQNDEKIVLNLS